MGNGANKGVLQAVNYALANPTSFLMIHKPNTYTKLNAQKGLSH